MANEWLRTEHPVYTKNKKLWERMERRFFGGDDVLEELVPFRWEADYLTDSNIETPNYEGRRSLDRRRNQATYINYPNLFARTMVGHIMRSAPQPEQGLTFGRLGVAARREGQTQPTRAELLYYNADGVGNDGSQWDNFWSRVAENSFATGHRWLMMEAPAVRPTNLRDEMNGLRPYLVEYSPTAVTNWHFTEGKLDFAIVKTSRREPRIVDDRLEGNESEPIYLLLVRSGFLGFGDQYMAGGWWIFDKDGEQTGQSGDWERTQGEIPMWVHYYERSRRENQMSRSAIVEISQAAVSYMNLSSAADFDAWDAASSTLYFMGVDQEAFNLMAEKTKGGSKLIPVPANKNTDKVPDIFDGSTGAVTAEVFETRLERKKSEAMQAAALEATSEPGSSGASKMAGFADVKAPRLTLLAGEMEASQNIAIRFAEMRWQDKEPTGFVQWRREFELLPLVESIREVFEVAEIAGAKSATLTVNGIMALVNQKGLARDDDEAELIQSEILSSFGDAAESDRQLFDAEAAEREAAEAVLAAIEAGGEGDTTGIEPGVGAES